MTRFCLIALLTLLPLQNAWGNDLIIFLHNAFYENNKDGQSHPQYGPYDFDGIIQALEGGAEKIIAPKRSANTSVEQGALQVVNMVKAALLRGTKPERIKIIGASKGAYIAMVANQNLPTEKLKWVIVGGCSSRIVQSGFQLNGQVLSIYETSDTVAGSCPQNTPFTHSAHRFREIALLSGLDHGFQFKPDPAWIEPALKW